MHNIISSRDSVGVGSTSSLTSHRRPGALSKGQASKIQAATNTTVPEIVESTRRTCAHTTEDRYLVADEHGVLCSYHNINWSSGCCSQQGASHSEIRQSMTGICNSSCNKANQSNRCCDSFPACVACCLKAPAEQIGGFSIPTRDRAKVLRVSNVFGVPLLSGPNSDSDTIARVGFGERVQEIRLASNNSLSSSEFVLVAYGSNELTGWVKLCCRADGEPHLVQQNADTSTSASDHNPRRQYCAQEQTRFEQCRCRCRYALSICSCVVPPTFVKLLLFCY